MATPEASLTLAIDMMGGDEGPKEVLEGLALALDEVPRSANFLLVGREDEILPHIERNPLLASPSKEGTRTLFVFF